MSRNAETRFALNPVNLDIHRSRFDINWSVKTTFNVGDIVPMGEPIEVLPGDTFNLKTSKVIRMPSLLTPFMDNIYLDVYHFFVPMRLVWNHWKQFLGENDKTSWIPETTYQIPTIKFRGFHEDEGIPVNSVADYMGLPTWVPGIEVSALPFRAYALVCNEWFRDENLSDPLVVNLGDESYDFSDITGDYSDVPVLERPAHGLDCYKAAKFHDYFTSALPAPQKGPDVALPLGSHAPVVASNLLSQKFNQMFPNGTDALHMMFHSKDSDQNVDAVGRLIAGDNDPNKGDIYMDGSYGLTESQAVFPSNLVALLGDATGATVNQLRIAFQLQKFYERAARGGTRYTELLKSFFGVTAPDASLQRPEYLGGNRIPIHVNQVIQQSATSSTPLGNTAAMSMTTDSHQDFVKSFTEHGYVVSVMVARYDHTYQQGISKMWSRRDRFDHYFPVFANLGEMPILNKEIYATGNSDVDDEVFGYQEAWAEYRYRPSIVTGLMRSKVNNGEVTDLQSIDSWHLADYYRSRPYLSDSWIREDSANVNRVLAVGEQAAGFQLFADIYFQNRATRPMPLYSIPGLIDHH